MCGGGKNFYHPIRLFARDIYFRVTFLNIAWRAGKRLFFHGLNSVSMVNLMPVGKLG